MPTKRPSFLTRWCPNAEWVLLLVLALEIAVFAIAGDNFLSVENGFEITRLAAEIGLLAFGLTLVIKTGGIDLSVGSMMGLGAVVLGASWSGLGLPIWIAATLTVVLGAAGGALNGLLITRLRVPPLIVTLGTFSLFRGLAEAATGGYVSYTGFPSSFLALGQNYLGGFLPVQFIVFLVVFIALWLLLHRTVFGRELTALGFNAAGARFAGVRVGSITLRSYIICGICAALAGIVYVARIGQAKADAGTGYELLAIAAVVLGGTAIAGGRGTLHGTLLGLLCLVVLQNGLRLSGQPSEIAGLCAGLILIVAIALNQLWNRQQRAAQIASTRPLSNNPNATSSDFDMKNSQVALIIAAILGGAVLIAASNIFLARSLTGSPAARNASGSPEPVAKKLVVAMTPKAKADPYFVSCKQGADEAAAKLGVDILWDAPTDPDPAKQNEIVEAWITKGVDVIAASCASPEAISSVLRKAQQRGIKVITWDADARSDARSFFVNQATAQGIGSTLADEGSRLAGGEGEYAIITASLTDANQNEWIKFIKERMAAAHPKMKLAAIHPCDGQRDKAMLEAKNITRAYPNVKSILAICSPAVPGAAEALKQEGRTNVKLTGLSTPNLNREYVKDGWVQSIVLWNTMDLGYLTVTAAKALHDGSLAPGASSVAAGKLGSIAIDGDNILLGKPFVFTKENIDQFKF
ncbi:ABC transporter permease [Nibricoccus aquaticus]|uniref:Autoinducer 2 import system permease protein LsrD n=1 Tax=Nibricoccus aquaticus TaxID=2576891 RepID=A0A290QBD9_9BACT|nr:ABC transporter permease [Nibricoccus aquaticus]